MVLKGVFKTEWGREAGALSDYSVGKGGATAYSCACFVHKANKRRYLLNEWGEPSPHFGHKWPKYNLTL